MTVKNLAVVTVLMLASGGRAAAHPEFSSMGTNRYVTAAVFDRRVDVTDAWLHGALAAAELRRGLDVNHDGTIDAAELQSAEARLRAEGAYVAVELDGGAATAPLTVAIDLGDDPRVGPAPCVVERRVRLARAADARETQVRLTVTREPPRLLETELSVVLGPDLHLTDPDRVRFNGPRRSSLENRHATFTVVASSAQSKLPLVAVAVIAAGVAGAAWLRFRRKKRHDAMTPRPDQKAE
jgi:hypothetical protein